MPQVSAIVPCFNAGRYLRETIQGLKAQTIPFAEILVVDDGSRDDTNAIAADCGCSVIRHARNRGLSAARNTGIANARSDIVACIDADVLLDSEWLARLLPELAEPQVVQAGGSIIERYQNSAADRWRALHMKLDYGDGSRRLDKQTRGRLSGFATLAKRKALQDVGLYDGRFGRSYEDVDLSLRLIDHGYTLSYEPNAAAHHLRQDSVRSLLASCWSWNFWPATFKGCYRSWQAVLAKMRFNITASRQLATQHIARRDYALVAIDVSLLFASSFWDLRYYLSSHFSWARSLFGPSHLGNVAPSPES